MPRTLILDLDGTLVDSAADLAGALNRLMLARDLAPFSRPAVVGMIGDGVAALVRRGLAARGQEPDPAALAAFSADYARHAADETRPYPGTAETLQRLAAAGWRLGVCTNKPLANAHAILRTLGLDGLVHGITGGDGPRKPDPAHMFAAVAAVNGSADMAVALGDHRNDIAAAQAAGMPSIFAGWGYGPPCMAEGAAAFAAAIQDVPSLADRLLPEEIGRRARVTPLK